MHKRACVHSKVPACALSFARSALCAQAALIVGLDYLVNISYVDNVEVFKTCLDYWNYFVPDVYAR